MRRSCKLGEQKEHITHDWVSGNNGGRNAGLDSTRLNSTQLTASSIHDSVTENENAWIERIESCRLPCLDLNQEPIPNWTVLEILVDLGTADAANLFFQIVEQLRGSEEQDRLEISGPFWKSWWILEQLMRPIYSSR